MLEDYQPNENQRKEVILSKNPYLNLFLQADTFIGAISNSQYAVQHGEQTEWLQLFKKATFDMKTTITADYQREEKQQLRYHIETPVSHFVKEHGSNFFNHGISQVEAVSVLGIVFILGYELHNDEDINLFLPDIQQVVKEYGYFNGTNSREVINELMLMGKKEWQKFSIPRIFTEADYQDPFAHSPFGKAIEEIDLRWIDKGTGKVNDPNLDIFRDFIDGIDGLDDIGK